MDWLQCRVVEQVDGKVSGAPVIRGSRVRPDDLLNNLELPEAELALEFGLSQDDVHEVLAFYKQQHGSELTSAH